MELKALILFIAAALLAAEPSLADAGDVLAGLIGTVLILILICAGLGWWSRR